MLLAVIFLVALLTISLAIALPRISKQIQRDREIETMHRGKQIIRGVKFYYKKFGAYPPSYDVLAKQTNNIRFLRKKYTDPTTGKPDWKGIPLGMNKAPTVMGFFGQPLGGVGGCGTNPLGTSASSVASTSAGFGGTSSGSAIGMPGAGSPTDPSQNCAGAGLTSSTTTPPGASTTNPSDPNAASPTDPNAANAGSSSGSGTSAFGAGQTFGGAGMMGFSPNSPKQSIMIYKKKTHYNEWEFVYDPRADLLQGAGGAQPVTPIQPGAPGVSLPPSPTPTPQTGSTQTGGSDTSGTQSNQ